MNKILVHLHVYYHDQVDYFIEKLKNINGVEWDLAVTFSEQNQNTIDKLKTYKPDTKFFKVSNYGYDIWPFIYVIKTTDLVPYKYVVKLHTKRSVKKCAANVIPMKGFRWRDSLVDGILFSPSHFNNLTNKMDENPEIGMVSNLMTYSKRNWDSYYPKVKEELDKLGLEAKDNHFCMGTMFIGRAEVFNPLKSDKIDQKKFEDTENDNKRDFTSAHYYERLLSVLPSTMGLKHITVSPRLKEWIIIKTVRILEKPVRWIFGIEKKGEDKRKFMRILGMEFYIEKKK